MLHLLNTVLSTAVGGVVGFGAAVFAPPVREWLYRPQLELAFGDGSAFRARTPELLVPKDGGPIPRGPREADYIRIRVRNIKPAIAKNCRAYLVDIEKADSNGNFNSTIYSDSLPLAWSNRGDQAYRGMDLPKGVAHFVDIVSTRTSAQSFRLETDPVPYRYVNLLHERGKFRLTVQVSGEDVRPVYIKVIFVWSGVWDKYEAHLG